MVRLEDLLQRPTTSSSRAFKGFFPPPSSPSGRSSSLPPPVFIDSHSTAGAGTPSTCSSLSQFSLVLETGAALDEVTTGAGTEEPAARADISCDPARDEGRQRRKLVEDYDSDSSGLSEPEEMDEENEERWEHATRVEAAPAPLDDRSLKRSTLLCSAAGGSTSLFIHQRLLLRLQRCRRRSGEQALVNLGESPRLRRSTMQTAQTGSCRHGYAQSTPQSTSRTTLPAIDAVQSAQQLDLADAPPPPFPAHQMALHHRKLSMYLVRISLKSFSLLTWFAISIPLRS